MRNKIISISIIVVSAVLTTYSQNTTAANRLQPIMVVSQASQGDEERKLIEGNAVLVFTGDTISIAASDLSIYTIKLKGISAPAQKQRFGPESAKKLSYLVQGMNVTVIVSRVDNGGHQLGSVLLDGEDVGLAQVRNGMAWSRDKFDGDLSDVEREIFARAEQKARADRVGLWADADPVPPWIYSGEKGIPSLEANTTGTTPAPVASETSLPSAPVSAPQGNQASASKPATTKKYILGPRGGCYYVNNDGAKVYVKNKTLCGEK